MQISGLKTPSEPYLGHRDLDTNFLDLDHLNQR